MSCNIVQKRSNTVVHLATMNTFNHPDHHSIRLFPHNREMLRRSVVVVVSHIQRIGCQPEKTTLHGGQSRSWSAEQGKENKRKSLAAYPPPPTPHTARSEKINKITRRIYRRYAGGRSRARTRIPSARRLGLWVWLRKILHSRLR